MPPIGPSTLSAIRHARPRPRTPHAHAHAPQARALHSPAPRTRNPLPASFLRGGTSKGLFFRARDLPADAAQWGPVMLGAMGSPDAAHGRQLDGMGGGVSSLSKVVVVGPAEGQADVAYTFVQVGVRDALVDMSGNCGNLSSVVGVFALDAGLCAPRTVRDGRATVRALNTNTGKLVDTTFPVALQDGRYTAVLDKKETSIAGVPGRASRILLEILDPAGARTGALLPSGSPLDTLTLNAHPVRASLVDATNPTVFLSASDLTSALGSALDYTNQEHLDALETLRLEGARKMGMVPTQAQPKVAVLSRAAGEGSPNPPDDPDQADIAITALSLAVPHRAVPMTVGLCLGAACAVPSSLAWDLLAPSVRGRGGVRMRHPAGVVEVTADLQEEGAKEGRVGVVRTGRRLMRGEVWW